MRSQLLIGSLLATVAIVPALAQSSPPASSPSTPPAAAAPSSSSAATTPATQSSDWRASKLIGLNVYNDQNDKLGSIDDVLIQPSGKIDGIVIGVGGFLGVGQRNIKVDMSQLKFVNEPVRTSANTGGASSPTGATTGTATRPSGAAPSASNANSTKWAPDHAVLSGATKDQLNNMPEFKY